MKVSELIDLLSQYDPDKKVVMEYDNEYGDLRAVVGHTVLIGPKSYADYVGIEALDEGSVARLMRTWKSDLEDYKCAPQEDVVVIAMRSSWI